VTPKRYLLTAGIMISVQMGLLAGLYAYSGMHASDLVTSGPESSKPEASPQGKISLALSFKFPIKAAANIELSKNSSASATHSPKQSQLSPLNAPQKPRAASVSTTEIVKKNAAI
jgi:periplasmic protein TonB